MIKKIIIIMGIILTLSLICAADFTPQGNITLRNVYNIQNATSLTIGNGTVMANSSGFFGWLNWSWLTNIPSYVRDWSSDITGNYTALNNSKLDKTDQRYNDSAKADYQYGSNNFNGSGNITATWFKGLMSWSDIRNFPVACPTGTYVTNISGTITCTAVTKLTNDLNMTGNNITNVNAVYYQNNSGANVWRTYYNGSALITEVA